MTTPLEKLEAEALDLSPPERAQLAHRLIASLDAADVEDQTVVEHAWEEEIRQRLEEYRAGRTQTSPASEVFARARARLR